MSNGMKERNFPQNANLLSQPTNFNA